MVTSCRNVAICAGLVLSLATPGFAQSVDTSGVENACVPAGATEADCLAAIEAFIDGLAGVSLDVALGSLAATLATSSLSIETNSPVIAVALSAIGSAVNDPAQATQIAAISAAVEAGSDFPLAAVGDPVPASPN